MNNIQSAVNSLALSYDFTPKEITVLARFFRSHQDEIPDGLEDFAAEIERVIYDSMSIEEARQFYS